MVIRPEDYEEQARRQQQKQQWSGWNADNVFNSWDLNPLAAETGVERDRLSLDREAFLKPKYQEYRSAVGEGNSADDDFTLFNDRNFQNFVRTGQAPQSWQTSQGQSVTSKWNATQQQATAAAPQNQSRNDHLYNLLVQRATQSTQIDRNDPAVRTQVDAYSANEERARRNYLSDLAERSGPLANLRGEERMAAERLGQRTGAFEAELVARQLMSRRQEIAEALQSMQGMLTAAQQEQLARELALLDNAIAESGIQLQSRSLDMDWQKALMQNEQATADLGLRAEDRAAYYDLVRRGLLRFPGVHR